MGLGGRRFARRQGAGGLFRRPPSVRPGGRGRQRHGRSLIIHGSRRDDRGREGSFVRSCRGLVPASSLHSHANARERVCACVRPRRRLDDQMDVYSAGEDPIEGVSGQTIVDCINALGDAGKAAYVPSKTKRSRPSSTRFVRAICSLDGGGRYHLVRPSDRARARAGRLGMSRRVFYQ